MPCRDGRDDFTLQKALPLNRCTCQRVQLDGSCGSSPLRSCGCNRSGCSRAVNRTMLNPPDCATLGKIRPTSPASRMASPRFQLGAPCRRRTSVASRTSSRSRGHPIHHPAIADRRGLEGWRYMRREGMAPSDHCPSDTRQHSSPPQDSCTGRACPVD